MASPPDSTHESYQQGEIKLGSDRGFGVTFSVVFGIIGSIGIWRGFGIPMVWFGAAIAILIVSIAKPNLLHPLNKIWHQFGLLLGRITTPIVMGLLFFVAVTPTGLVMRMLGKRTLELTFDAKADSYWIPRDPPGPDPQSMKQQF